MEKHVTSKIKRKGHTAWNKGKRYSLGNRNGGYYAIHKWLKKYYGKANHCEYNECNGQSKMFQWALIKGKKYKYKRENFIQLCSRCHRLYDQKPDWIERMRKTKTGVKLSNEHKNKIRIGMLKHDRTGSNNPYWKGGKYAR